MRVLRDAGVWMGGGIRKRRRAKGRNSASVLSSHGHPASFLARGLWLNYPLRLKASTFIQPRRHIFTIPLPIELLLQEAWRARVVAKKKVLLPPSLEEGEANSFGDQNDPSDYIGCSTSSSTYIFIKPKSYLAWASKGTKKYSELIDRICGICAVDRVLFLLSSLLKD